MEIINKAKNIVLKGLETANKNYYYHAVRDDLKYIIPYMIWKEEYIYNRINRKFKLTFDRKLNLDNPQTMGEKLQWLKINVHEDFHTVCADKYSARQIWKEYGEDGLIPLLYRTDSYKDITLSHIPEEPCIIKSNTGCGDYQIIRSKTGLNIKKLRERCRIWMHTNYYYISQEWQYKNIEPCILIEKLLLDQNGCLPNDYKLHFINGELQFIYCSIDREGLNYRSIYDPDWNEMDLEWVNKDKHKGIKGKKISKPLTLDRMIEIGSDIAKKFAYVRVDFYEVEGKLYYGEITLYHGSGMDTFEPMEYDYIFGNKLVLPQYDSMKNKWVYYKVDSLRCT